MSRLQAAVCVDFLVPCDDLLGLDYVQIRLAVLVALEGCVEPMGCCPCVVLPRALSFSFLRSFFSMFVKFFVSSEVLPPPPLDGLFKPEQYTGCLSAWTLCRMLAVRCCELESRFLSFFKFGLSIVLISPGFVQFSLLTLLLVPLLGDFVLDKLRSRCVKEAFKAFSPTY